MTAAESCRAAESRLADAARLLSQPKAEPLGEAIEALAGVIEILEQLAAGNSRDWDPAVHLAVHRIRAGAQRLNLQIDHASRLLCGWMQRKFSTGYTPRGLPEFADRDSGRFFEA